MNKAMKDRFSRLSLGAKQILVITSTSIICILFACTTFFVNDFIFSKKNFDREVDVIMDLIRSNSVAPLYFGDPDAGEEILSSLAASPDIVAAALYTPDGDLFATYTLENLEETWTGFPILTKKGAHGEVWQMDPDRIGTVSFKGETIGYLYFFTDLARYNRMIMWYASLTLIILVVAVVIAVFMSSYLRRFVTAPLYHLYRVAKTISREKDFSVRARAFYEDEIGQLIIGFNEMIEKIQRRDHELDRHRKTLEKTVAKRTSDLVAANAALTRLNQDYRLAREKAEQASKAKSDFLASMSHELRTPLNGIIGYTQLFKKFDNHLDARERERIAIIRECGEHLLDMINDILDLSKVEAGKMEIHSDLFSLDEFVAATVAIAKSQANEKGLAVETGIGTFKGPRLVGDAQRIRQVLLNLLSNAVKFTEKGKIGLFVEPLENGFTRFRVEDTGPGIPEEYLSSIFDSFSQAGDVNRKSEGTGLGLAISRKLVRLMGGDIHVKSRIGKGSCFWFDLPLSASGRTKGETDGSFDYDNVTGYVRKDGSRAPYSVLIVDDVDDSRRLLKEAFGYLGFETAEAGDGKGAVEACERKTYDLVLMDVVMPGMNGIDAAGKILSGAAPRHRPAIIAVSASINKGMASQVTDAGCSCLVPKPIRMEVLLKAVENDLDLVWEAGVAEPPGTAKSPMKISREDRDVLLRLLADGDIAAVQEWCGKVPASDPERHRAAVHMGNLARQFRINEIKAFLESDPKGA